MLAGPEGGLGVGGWVLSFVVDRDVLEKVSVLREQNQLDTAGTLHRPGSKYAV
jgi:hypothetical protein